MADIRRQLRAHLEDALSKIAGEASGSKLKHLKESCNGVLGELRASKAGSELGEWEELRKFYLVPFKLSCETKAPKVIGIAVDGLQRFFALGVIPKQDADVAFERQLVDLLVGCLGNATISDETALQTMKVLNVLVVSPRLERHGAELIGLVQTYASLFIRTKNLAVRTTVRAGITQLLIWIQRRGQETEVPEVSALDVSHSSAIVVAPGTPKLDERGPRSRSFSEEGEGEQPFRRASSLELMAKLASQPSVGALNVASPPPQPAESPAEPALEFAGVLADDCNALFKFLQTIIDVKAKDGASKAFVADVVHMTVRNLTRPLAADARYHEFLQKLAMPTLVSCSSSPTREGFRAVFGAFAELLTHPLPALRDDLGRLCRDFLLRPLSVGQLSDQSLMENRLDTFRAMTVLLLSPALSETLCTGSNAVDSTLLSEFVSTASNICIRSAREVKDGAGRLQAACLEVISAACKSVYAGGAPSIRERREGGASNIFASRSSRKRFNSGDSFAPSLEAEDGAVPALRRESSLARDGVAHPEMPAITPSTDADSFVVSLCTVIPVLLECAEPRHVDAVVQAFASAVTRGGESLDQSLPSADAAYVVAYGVLNLCMELHGHVRTVCGRGVKRRHLSNRWFVASINADPSLPREFPIEWLSLIYNACAANDILSINGFDPRAHSRGAFCRVMIRQVRHYFDWSAHSSPRLNEGASAARMGDLPARGRLSAVVGLSADTGPSVASPASVRAASAPPASLSELEDSRWLRFVQQSANVLEASTPALTLLLDHKGTTDYDTYALATEVGCIASALAMTANNETALSVLIEAVTAVSFSGDTPEAGHRRLLALRSALTFGLDNGAFLGTPWVPIHRCMSQYFKHRAEVAEAALANAPEEERDGKETPQKEKDGKDKKERDSRPAGLRRLMRRDSSKASIASVDRAVPDDDSVLEKWQALIETTAAMPFPAVAYFMDGLAVVALEELREKPMPRTRALSTMCRVAVVNANRQLLEWSRLWASLSSIAQVAFKSANSDALLPAVEGVLAVIEERIPLAELEGFEGKARLFTPFSELSIGNDETGLREFAVKKLAEIIGSYAPCLRSGWSTLFPTLAQMARRGIRFEDESRPPVLSVLEQLVSSAPEVLWDAGIDAIRCLVGLCRDRSNRRADQAVELLNGLLDKLAKLQMEPAEDDRDPSLPPLRLRNSERCAEEGAPLAERQGFPSAWRLVVEGLAQAVFECHPEAQSSVIDALFRVISEHGVHMPTKFLETFFSVGLMTMLDDLTRHKQRGNKEKSDRENSFRRALTQAVVFFAALSKRISREKMEQLFDFFLRFMQKTLVGEKEKTARAAAAAFRVFASTCGADFTPREWNAYVDALAKACGQTMPPQLWVMLPADFAAAPKTKKLDALTERVFSVDVGVSAGGHATADGDAVSPLRSAPPSKHQRKRSSIVRSPTPTEATEHPPNPYHGVLVRLGTHLSLLSVVGELLAPAQMEEPGKKFGRPKHIAHPPLSEASVTLLLACLERSIDYARKFNANMILRQTIVDAGLSKGLPNLFKQEAQATEAYLAALFALFEDESRPSIAQSARVKLVLRCEAVCQDYVAAFKQGSRDHRHWTPIIVSMLRMMAGLKQDKFEKVFRGHFSHAWDLILVDSHDVRVQMRAVIDRALALRLIVSDPPDEHALHAHMATISTTSPAVAPSSPTALPAPDAHPSRQRTSIADTAPLHVTAPATAATPTRASTSPTTSRTPAAAEPVSRAAAAPAVSSPSMTRTPVTTASHARDGAASPVGSAPSSLSVPERRLRPRSVNGTELGYDDDIEHSEC